MKPMSTASISPAPLFRSVWRASLSWVYRSYRSAASTNAIMLPAPTVRSCSVAATGCPTNIPRRRRAGALTVDAEELTEDDSLDVNGLSSFLPKQESRFRDPVARPGPPLSRYGIHTSGDDEESRK